VTTWPALVDMRDIPKIKGDLVNMTNMIQNISTTGSGTFNTLITNEGDIDTRINNIETALASGWSTLEAVLGEDVTAGDNIGAVFYGEGIMSTKYVWQQRWWSDLEMGADGDPSKIGFSFTTPVAFDQADYIRSVALNIKKVWAPTDNILFNLFESDKTTPVAGFTEQAIAWWDLTTSYTTETVDLQDIQLTADTEYFLEIKRSGAQDLSNYYQFEYSLMLDMSLQTRL